MLDQDIVTGSPSWSATPWNYSSMRFMQFGDDGSGLLLYGYGQTIYAKINIQYTMKTNNELEIQYLDSPPLQRFAGFAPVTDSAMKTLHYKLSEDRVVFKENVTGADFSFKWSLSIDRCPFPDTLTLPYETPLTFYGYREDLRSGRDK